MADRDREDGTAATDPNALVQQVVRESVLQMNEDLRHYAEKVRYFNALKKAIREYLSELRGFAADLKAAAREQGVDLCRPSTETARVIAELIEKHARTYPRGDVELDLCIPDRVPAIGVIDRARLDAEIARWEGRLATVGDDAQLANVDLQNILQKQQQALQMLSNISKAVHDNAMSIIRKIGG